jgi:hypothetical protein
MSANYLSTKKISTSDLSRFTFSHLDKISQISAIFRNLFTMIAIFIAGVWSYYVFIKGRTFKPKLNMDISLGQKFGINEENSIIKCKILNSGKIRIKPLYVKAKFYYGQIQDSHISYIQFDENENILNGCYEPNETIFLEPQDEMNIDFCLFTGKIKKDVNKDCLNSIIMIRLYFVDAKYHVWKETALLCIDNGKENKNE